MKTQIKKDQIWKIATEDGDYYEKVIRVDRWGVHTIDQFGMKSGYPHDMFPTDIVTLTEYKSFDEINR